MNWLAELEVCDVLRTTLSVCGWNGAKQLYTNKVTKLEGDGVGDPIINYLVILARVVFFSLSTEVKLVLTTHVWWENGIQCWTWLSSAGEYFSCFVPSVSETELGTPGLPSLLSAEQYHTWPPGKASLVISTAYTKLLGFHCRSPPVSLFHYIN